MSQGPSTLGSMMTSSLLPAAATISVTSSSAQGELSALMRVHSPVAPKSVALRHGDEAGARLLLGLDRNGVLQIAQHHVDLAGKLGHLGAQLLDMRRHEMDHALEPHRQLAQAAPARRWRAERRTGGAVSSGKSFPISGLPFRGMQRPRQVGAKQAVVTAMQPLSGLLVLDFTTLLPGPLAALMLAEAGAEVVKIERPGGEDMRRFPPMFDGESATFAMLNRGKSVLTVDLKSEADREKLKPLLMRADILVEQFRPGVMARLGLGYDDVRALNPRLIYCSISRLRPETARAPARPATTSITSAIPGCSTCSRGRWRSRWCRRR